jgi:uncharacterized protein
MECFLINERRSNEPMLHDSAYMWVAPLVAMVIAQILKPVLIMIHLRRFDWQRMRQSGGMPSSHTALVVALVTEMWLRYGGRDPILGLGVFIALIVMYDAAGVRWQTGRQAAVLNRMLHDLQGHHAHSINSKLQEMAEVSPPNSHSDVATVTSDAASRPTIKALSVAKAPWWLMDWPVLNEHVGHKPSEVLGGFVVGVLVALSLH